MFVNGEGSFLSRLAARHRVRRLRGAGGPDAGRGVPELQAHPLLPPPLRLLVRAPAQRAGCRGAVRGVPRRTDAGARRMRGGRPAAGASDKRVPVTPDGRYFVVRGRLWRCSDPSLSAAERARLTRELMAARRAVRAALA